MKRLLVTGGAGLIGSHFVRHILRNHDYLVVNLDGLKYAGNMDNLDDIKDHPHHVFIKGDISDVNMVSRTISEYKIDTIVNFAAETHVDRSITDPQPFVQTNICGTYVLLEAVRKFDLDLMLQISTDEVYGSVEEGASLETDPLKPNNPYSASKASADMMARAYYQTYRTPIIITRGCNNFGPYQYPEKMIPLFVTNAMNDRPLPVYGTGLSIRDYIYVTDHCAAIDLALHKGTPGDIYNIGAENLKTVLDVANLILELMGKPQELINFVEDRPGHDKRYCLDSSKIRSMGWRPQRSFEAALEETINWYLENQNWFRNVKERSRIAFLAAGE